jgi:hypothetical protein
VKVELGGPLLFVGRAPPAEVALAQGLECLRHRDVAPVADDVDELGIGEDIEESLGPAEVAQRRLIADGLVVGAAAEQNSLGQTAE